MKKIAKDFYRKLLVGLLLIVFLIGSIINVRSNTRTQSNFAKNTLGFLLLTSDKDELKSDIGKFNISHDQTISYIENEGDLARNYGPEDIDKLNLNKSVRTDGIFSFRANYFFDEVPNIILSIPYGLGFYINIFYLLILAGLGLVLWFYLGNKVDKDIDAYLSNISPDKASSYLSDPEYDDIRPLIISYQRRIRKASEEASMLKRRLEDFITITSNMKEGFILFDGDGKIELMNESAMRYLGVGQDATISNLIRDKEYVLALREAKILKRSKSIDLKINDYFLRIFIDPLQSSTKKAFAMIIIDNTEDKRAEQMRREFSANVTHELKSPLTSINGYAELIATGIAKEDDMAKFGEIIYKEGNRLLEIIDDILKISKLDEKNYERDFSPVNVGDVVATTIEKYDRVSAKKNITVVNDVEAYRINTSKSLFHDLVSNIYENAIKYNKIGGSIKVSNEMHDNSYILIIEDTGIGIGKADMARIFERFYVVDKSRKRNQKSTGLGLSIVKHIANYLGYEVTIDSVLDEGSRFKIIIPLDLDREI